MRGVGPDTASTLLTSAGDNTERLRNERTFASLTDSCPVPATSGLIQKRYRLDRGGDRAANAALWRIAMVRMSSDRTTCDYIAKRQAEGKTRVGAMRCLKRYIAREVFNALTRETLV